MNLRTVWRRITTALIMLFVVQVLVPATAHALPDATTPPTPTQNPAEVLVNGETDSVQVTAFLSELGGILRGAALVVGAWMLFTGIKSLGSKNPWRGRAKTIAGGSLLLYGVYPPLLLSFSTTITNILTRIMGG